MSTRITQSVVLSVALAAALDAHASPPVATQVKQVAEWFSGEFDNSAQVTASPQTPFLRMSTCEVQVPDSGEEGVRTVYLEQYVVGNPSPLRVRLYTIRPADDHVTMSIQRFTNQSALLGMCSRPVEERSISAASLVPGPCVVPVGWTPGAYFGTNAPTGCPASFPGGKVVSDVTVRGAGIDSIDRILDASGNQLAGTLIEFRHIEE